MAQPKTQEETSLNDIRGLYPEFSRILISRLNQLLPQQQAARENLDEQVMTTPGDDADLSVLDTSADYFLRMANNQQREILEVREALERIQRGTYGICQDCGGTIAINRLRRLPEARLCVDCQAATERGSTRNFPNARPKL